MKTFKSLPSQTGQPFFERYATLIHSLTKFGVIAQIITGAAEIGIIYSLLYPSFIDLFPSVAHPLSITGALFCASLLQVGLKKVFPYSVRAILFKRFTGLDLPLSIAIFLLTIALLSVSVLLSYKGSQDIIDVAIAPPLAATTTAADSIKAVTEQRAAAIFSTDSATIETKYLGKFEAIQSEHQSRIDATEGKATKSRTASPSWSKDLSAQANGMKAELKTKLATLKADKANEIEAKATERKATIAHATDRNDIERTDIKAANSEAKAATEQRKGKYKNYVGYFTLFCYIFFLIGFVLDEIYKKGAGIEETVLPHQRHFSPSLFAEWLEAVKARYDTFVRSKIYAFADKTNASPLPVALHSLYDFKATALKNVHTIEVEEMDDDETRVIKLPMKPLKVAAKRKDDTKKADDTEPKKTRQIGFRKDDDTTLSTDEQLKIKGGKSLDDTGVHNDFRYTANLNDDTSKVYTVRATTGGDFGKCEHCGNDFFRNHKKQRFCKEECRKNAWALKTGKDFDLSVKNKERKKK
jgi:hypothetical protein